MTVAGAGAVDLLDDPDLSGDAYSHWCAGTPGQEMPAGWEPGQDGAAIIAYRVTAPHGDYIRDAHRTIGPDDDADEILTTAMAYLGHDDAVIVWGDDGNAYAYPDRASARADDSGADAILVATAIGGV